MTGPVAARAVGINRFGGPEVLEVLQRTIPAPGPGEVRVRVAGAAVNPVDTLLRDGTTSGGMDGIEPPYVPGMELAGVVETAGEGAPFAPGDRVMAMTTPFRPESGAQSEYVLLPADSVVHVPDAVDLLAAATIPMNGLTARRALDLLQLQPGQVLAVTGAAGIVGGYTVQLAREAGLRVVADAAPADRELVESFGPDDVVERGEGFADAVRAVVPGGVDGLVDAAVMGPVVAGALAPGAGVAKVRLVEYGDDVRSEMVIVREYLRNTEALSRLGELAAAGRLHTRVAETCGPEQAGDAHRRLASGGLRGRWVVTFD